MVTNLLNVLPAMLLVGLRVKAVARAFATADAAVEVYCVCAMTLVASAARTMRRRMMKAQVIIFVNET
jgi:hypothetical protein